MGVQTSEVGYTIATTRRKTTKVHKNMFHRNTLSNLIRFNAYDVFYSLNSYQYVQDYIIIIIIIIIIIRRLWKYKCCVVTTPSQSKITIISVENI